MFNIECRELCEKRRNCLLQAISPFHSYISLVRENAVLCGNGLWKVSLTKSFDVQNCPMAKKIIPAKGDKCSEIK